MEKETKNQIVEMLNNGLLQKIEDTFNQELSMNCKFKIDDGYNTWNGYYMWLEETTSSAKEQLTATPLLRQMFDNAKIYGKVGYDAERSTIIFAWSIDYHHNFDSGSNGTSIMRFAYHTDTKELLIRK